MLCSISFYLLLWILLRQPPKEPVLRDLFSDCFYIDLIFVSFHLWGLLCYYIKFSKIVFLIFYPIVLFVNIAIPSNYNQTVIYSFFFYDSCFISILIGLIVVGFIALGISYFFEFTKNAFKNLKYKKYNSAFIIAMYIIFIIYCISKAINYNV